MAISSTGNRGTGASGTSGTTLTMSPSAICVVGALLLLVISKDNSSITDGDNSEVTSVTDTKSNKWVKLGEYANGSPGAAAGATTSIWLCRVMTELLTSDIITMTFASAITDKCASLWQFAVGVQKSLAPSAAPVPNEVNGANGFGSVSHSGLASKQRLYFRGLAKEVNSVTAITVSTGFTAITGMRSRNNAAAVIVRGEFRINTSTGETSNPTLAVSGDTTGVFLALEEVNEFVETVSLSASPFPGGRR